VSDGECVGSTTEEGSNTWMEDGLQGEVGSGRLRPLLETGVPQFSQQLIIFARSLLFTDFA
jgi:hypothetical protein